MIPIFIILNHTLGAVGFARLSQKVYKYYHKLEDNKKDIFAPIDDAEAKKLINGLTLEQATNIDPNIDW